MYLAVTVHMTSVVLWGQARSFRHLVLLAFGAVVSAPGATVHALCAVGLAAAAALVTPLSLLVTPAVVAHVIALGVRRVDKRIVRVVPA